VIFLFGGVVSRLNTDAKTSTRLGFIGTGNIASALVKGFCRAQAPPVKIIVSPRNAEKARDLAGEFSRVAVAENNQGVIDESDCVFLSVRPQAFAAAVEDLFFKSEQTVICLVATMRMSEIQRFVEPAQIVTRALPLPPAAYYLGMIPFYPNVTQVYEILAKIGNPIGLPDERELDLLWTLTALVAPFYDLMAHTSRWAADRGVNKQNADAYVASMFNALSAMAVNASARGFSDLVTEAATPGGLNEQALHIIRTQGGYDPYLDALNAILERLGG
jgi:pyrroline-5-carboxylate reductase